MSQETGRLDPQPVREGRHVKKPDPPAPSDSDQLDRVFQMHEDTNRQNAVKLPTGRLSKEERVWADAEAASRQETKETRYRPLQPRDDNRSGCLGGLMYAVFILCLSVILACLAWMAATDVLSLNKESFTATVVLPQSIFETEIRETVDEDGKVTQKTVTHADIDYLCRTLKQAGLIEYPWLFRMYCSMASADEKVRPGEYQLQSGYDYRALIQNMRPNGGGATTVNVTLTEGLTVREMFVLLERAGVSSFSDLTEAAEEYRFNYDFLAEPEEDNATRLEGYLFPDTYNFYVNMQASSAINKFLEQFNYHLTGDLAEAVSHSSRSLAELVTVASMIEKEAADDTERGAIASVIYNRLDAGMPLGIDATILYVHPDHDGAPTAEMLQENSPYNTRINLGLPPTPICNPGLSSLTAAVLPSETNYYYYALDTETGMHRFFSSAEEFNAFVATQNY